MKDQATAQQDLLDDGVGLSVGDLRSEVASISADDLQQQIEEASQAVEEANAEAQAASGDAARIESEMQGREADEAAVIAAAGKEAAFAKLNQIMSDAVVFHLASTLLENSFRQVETGSSPALLHRISETFRSLTDGAFVRVVTAENEKGVLRLMVEEPPDGAKKVRIFRRDPGTSCSWRSAWFRSKITSRPPRRCHSSPTTFSRPSTTDARWLHSGSSWTSAMTCRSSF